MATTKSRTPILRSKLSHQITERLLEEIRSGELSPGDKLPSERDLMEQFGVGRPAIREALQGLEKMGIVEIAHGERATIRKLDARGMFELIDQSARHLLFTSAQMLDDLKQARLLFETGMIKIAAAKARPGDIERLKDCLTEMKQSVGDVAKFVQADIRFHITIAEISGNPIYSAISGAMLNWLVEFHQELVRVPGAEQVTMAEHQAVLDRIAAKDPAGAQRAMTAHLTRASKLYRLPV
jgi:DNA-binding FadR family transcriptional regulator